MHISDIQILLHFNMYTAYIILYIFLSQTWLMDLVSICVIKKKPNCKSGDVHFHIFVKSLIFSGSHIPPPDNKRVGLNMSRAPASSNILWFDMKTQASCSTNWRLCPLCWHRVCACPCWTCMLLCLSLPLDHGFPEVRDGALFMFNSGTSSLANGQ